MMMIKSLIVVALLAVLVSAYPGQEKIVYEINSNPDSTWVAGVNPVFANAGEEEIKRMLGWKPNPELKAQLPVRTYADEDVSIPASYSVLDAYNYSSIHTVLNQGSCGSCWAFGAVEQFRDRAAILSKGQVNKQFSTQQLTSCGPCNGCEGGDAMSAQSYIAEVGLYTAAAYPYEEPTCAPSQQPCEPPFAPTKECHKVTNATSAPLKCNRPYSVGGFFSNKVDDIKKEIYTHGTVESCFTVTESFIHYTSGVYIDDGSKVLGGHCVSCVGYGTESGIDYFLCRNSWTTSWGDKGYFKIGVHQCGIDDDVVACDPEV